MKIAYCPACLDAFSLRNKKWRKCECGESGGQYNADRTTATLGGIAKVFGVANPFFSELWTWLSLDKQQEWRERNKYPQGDCWWGGGKGDTQIFRIESAKGPRVRMKVKRKDSRTNIIVVTDKREFTCGGYKLGSFEEITAPSNNIGRG